MIVRAIIDTESGALHTIDAIDGEYLIFDDGDAGSNLTRFVQHLRSLSEDE